MTDGETKKVRIASTGKLVAGVTGRRLKICLMSGRKARNSESRGECRANKRSRSSNVPVLVRQALGNRCETPPISIYEQKVTFLTFDPLRSKARGGTSETEKVTVDASREDAEWLTHRFTGRYEIKTQMIGEATDLDKQL